MTDNKPNKDIADTSKEYIKERLEFFDKKEEELKRNLEKGKLKELEIEKTLEALKKALEALHGGKKIFNEEGQQKTAVQQDIESMKNGEIIEKIEAVTTPEEKEIIADIVADKSLQETEKTINYKKNDPKIKNLLKKIGKEILLLGAVASVVW